MSEGILSSGAAGGSAAPQRSGVQGPRGFVSMPSVFDGFPRMRDRPGSRCAPSPDVTWTVPCFPVAQAVFSSASDFSEVRLSVRCLLDRRPSDERAREAGHDPSRSSSSASAVPVREDDAALVQVRALLFEEGVMPAPSTAPCPGDGGCQAAPVAQASYTTSASHVGLYLKVIRGGHGRGGLGVCSSWSRSRVSRSRPEAGG